MEKVTDNKYQQVAEILRKAASDAGLILVGPGDELHQIQIKNTLEREASRILLITGSGDLQATETPVLGPAKTIGGQPIKRLRKFTEADMVPSDDKLFQLKQGVNSAIEYFRADRTPESLIAQIPDLVIRGVAKKVGMTVTKDEPKVLLPEFVAEIQEKVREQFPKAEDLPDGDGEDESDVKEKEAGSGAAKVVSMDAADLQKAPENANVPVENIDALPAAMKDELPSVEQEADRVVAKQKAIADIKQEIEATKTVYEDLRAKVNSTKNKEKLKELGIQAKNTEDKIRELNTDLQNIEATLSNTGN